MIDIQAIRRIAEAAGQIIMCVYQRGYVVQSEQDDGSLTEAGLLADRHILTELRTLTPEIPVLSEASAQSDSELRRRWSHYWLVTPLDATKELSNKNDEFTVNIALIEHGEPVLGVVHAPALCVSYWGSQGAGAFKAAADGDVRAIRVAVPSADERVCRVIDSRSYISVEFDAFMAGMRRSELSSISSSLKLCLVAEGTPDLYPRMGPTSEWDTAAAHAVVSAAGGQVLAWPTLEPLSYIKRTDTLLNPFFIVCAALSSDWLPEVEPWKDGIVYERREHNSKAEVIWHLTQVEQAMRAASLNQRPRCIWLTGLSGSGKSTIANSLELSLHKAGRHTFLLDGDNVRQGLNNDLGMSAEDRAENIRRVGEVAKLMVDAGMIVVAAFISPFRADRDRVRALFSEGSFVEVFVDTPLKECERRDVKGLYAKARRGELKDFTGIDSSYEEPVSPDVHLLPGETSLQVCVETLLRALDEPSTRSWS
ncbi:adenylylsulfate kinase [Pseudomonas syringae pv. actinidiae ICMP 18807]|uniref:Multifunctional fusion protein n=1 Tax=Pseudomonas syringae pv. actinidiae ICMP 18807 TaxID=1194404 RepID=S6TXF6_PSESF|nr:adenylylsulfate kinase [Pseudomonas syringae pv. actinidiae ICMP 18807]